MMQLVNVKELVKDLFDLFIEMNCPKELFFQKESDCPSLYIYI